MDKELMKGSIDLLLLSLLSQKKLYGYEITKILKQMSKGNYEISEGTLYPALKRLEKRIHKRTLERVRIRPQEILSCHRKWTNRT